MVVCFEETLMFYFSIFYFNNYLFNFKHCHTQLYVIFYRMILSASEWIII